MFEVAFLWFVLSVVAGIIAARNGRSGSGYFLISIFFTPLAGLILAVALPKVEREDEDRALCPECAELVKRQAIKCKHCGADLAKHHAEAQAAAALQKPPG